MNAQSLMECALSSCRKQFEPRRADARYCSGACRAQASRERRDDGTASGGLPPHVAKNTGARAARGRGEDPVARGRTFATAPLRRSVDAGDVQALRREVAALAELLKGLRRDHEEMSDLRASCDEQRDERVFSFQEKMDDSLRDIRTALKTLSKGRANPNPCGGPTVDSAVAEHEWAIVELSRRIDRLSERLGGLVQAILKGTED